MADSHPSEYMTIGTLPEHIILHILSFLPTKEAISTSVLSKSWENRWTLVPALDFTPDHESLSRSIVDKAFECNKALFMRRLVIPQIHGITQSDLSSYVSYAIQRNVQQLDLNLDDKKIVFPCSINTLVLLKLSTTHSSYGKLLLGDEFRFPSLKNLHLGTITLESRDSSLLGFSSSRFPLLEEMVLRGAKFNHHRVHISLPTLTRLEIRSSEFKYELKIQSLDSLRYLVLLCNIVRDFHVENQPSIVEANIDIVSTRIRNDCEVDEFDGESLIRIVNAVSQVKNFKFSDHSMEGLRKASLNSSFHADSIQVFHNLVELELRLDDSLFDVAMIMLHKFENLQHLTIFYKTRLSILRSAGEDKIAWAPPTHVPNCLTKRLVTFCFQDFLGTKHAMEVTKYILKNSLVLVNAKIVFDRSVRFRKGCRSQRKLSTACIGSVGCQLEYDQRECNPKFDEWDSSYFDV